MKTIKDAVEPDEMERWPVRPYSKNVLACAYAPEIGERSALNRLSRWLRQNTQLYQSLLQASYRPTQQIFTSKQVELIFEYLGRP